MAWQPIDGFINLLKPPGPTSQEAVTLVRRILGAAKGGHAGTLDPMAAGVLVICLGRATRLAEYAGGGVKTYRAEITFGLTTDTLDAEGQVTAEVDASGVGEEALREALAGLTGALTQVPPAYSAVHVGGRRAYRHALSGAAVAPEPRAVQVHRLDLLEFLPGERPRALVEVECSRGTYVRSLALQIAERMGTVGYLSFLLRTRAGEFGIAQALTPDEVGDEVAAGRDPVLPLDWPLGGLPRLDLDEAQARRVMHGSAVEAPGEGTVRLYWQNEMIAVGEAGSGQARPHLVFRSEPQCS